MVTAAPPSEVAGSPRSDDDKGGDPLRRSQHWCIVLGSFSLTISYRPSPPMPDPRTQTHLWQRGWRLLPRGTAERDRAQIRVFEGRYGGGGGLLCLHLPLSRFRCGRGTWRELCSGRKRSAQLPPKNASCAIAVRAVCGGMRRTRTTSTLFSPIPDHSNISSFRYASCPAARSTVAVWSGSSAKLGAAIT